MEASGRDVALTIPAQPGYLVLARLALSAVCRLTPLEAVEIADLKLAVTEAANEFVDDSPDNQRTLDFLFCLEEDRLELRLSGPSEVAPTAEQELGRAIIEATVDEARFSPGSTVLVKRL